MELSRGHCCNRTAPDFRLFSISSTKQSGHLSGAHWHGGSTAQRGCGIGRRGS
jgi:hypothetical protein